MANQSDYQKAKEIVDAKISFLIHLLVYVLVNTILVIINLSTNSETIWFKWPMMGWGIGLVIHGFSVFLTPGISGLKERMIEKELNKQK